MRLVDRVAQCRIPFLVQDRATRAVTRLNGAADFATAVALCPTRYVLSDDLTRLCTALAYSKGARALACTDLIHVPATSVWVEWCESAWQDELRVHGFRLASGDAPGSGRRGAFVQSAPDGRCGFIRTFWSIENTEMNVLASSMEAYFDLDTEEDGEPASPDGRGGPTIKVTDEAGGDADVLRRCFRFRYERTWAKYYESTNLSFLERQAIAQHSLGTIAAAIPVLMAFFLLLASRTGLPQRHQSLKNLNRSRVSARKTPLLDHVDVQSPMLARDRPALGDGSMAGRRHPRLHHVRGHLVRRGNQLFWRVPHLRGNARSGAIRTRTVTWTFDRSIAEQSSASLH
ncbi:MAG TPA: hypothetical protein VGD54_05435 [Steroidobacteraceae bacterium]